MESAVIIPLFLGLRGAQLLIVLVLIILLFGAKRIPSLMRSMGKSIHSFKQGMAEAEAEMKKPLKSEDDKGAEETKAKDKDE